MDGPTPTSYALPGVDELTHRYAVFATDRSRVDLTPAVAQFLRITQVEGVKPILRTGRRARVSAHLGAELFAHAATWVVDAADWGFFDALAGRRIASYEDVLDRQALQTRGHMPLPDHRTLPAYGALNFEVLLHHRASASLRVGAGVEQIFALLGAQLPDVWGSYEPLTSMWNLTEVTHRAQREMPSSTVMRVAAPDGSWATIQYERGTAGVVERVRGGVLVGTYADVAATASDRARDVLRALCRTTTVTAAMVSLVDMDEGNSYRVRLRRPEVPAAALVGPWAINEARIDVDAMVDGYGGERLGRRAVPSLLFGFDGPSPAPWLNLAEILSGIGWENLAHAFGLDEERAHGG